MRLLLIPDPTSPNGEDAFCREVAKRAPARGHEAAIQPIPNGPLEATLETLSATGFALSADAVAINSLQPAALLAARAAGRKTAVRLIDSYAAASPQSLEEVRRLVTQADLLLVPSLYMAQVLAAWGANGSVRQVPYAYDRIMAQQIALVTLRASRQTGFQVVAAGALNEATRAGFETLLSGVARLRFDYHLTVIGDGPSLASLKERSERLYLGPKVTFLGSLPTAKTLEFFRGAKAFADPCGLDGFPALSLYALSEGCPVIAARAGAVAELIADGRNGLLFAPGDALGLSEAVTTLHSERGLSLKLIGEGIKTVESHSWDATVEAAFAALESLA